MQWQYMFEVCFFRGFALLSKNSSFPVFRYRLDENNLLKFLACDDTIRFSDAIWKELCETNCHVLSLPYGAARIPLIWRFRSKYYWNSLKTPHSSIWTSQNCNILRTLCACLPTLWLLLVNIARKFYISGDSVA